MILRMLTTAMIMLAPAQALAVDIPPGADPGAIFRHTWQTETLRNTQPWLTQPIRPEDIAPPPEPEGGLIEYKNIDIQGTIVVPGQDGKIQLFTH